MTKTLSWAPGNVARPLSVTLLHFVAAGLVAASDLLTRLATRLAAERAIPEAAPVTVEFHAFHRDAGAPEGALYVNGELVAIIPGVTRL